MTTPRLKVRLVAVLTLLQSMAIICPDSAKGTPVLADPSRFAIQLYADLGSIQGVPSKAFDLLLSNGQAGFRRGLFVTSPFLSAQPWKLLHVDSLRVVSLEAPFSDIECAIFAKGAYGQGMFITEPGNLRITRLLPNGTTSTFATLGTPPFGPTAMDYGLDGKLYVSDGSGGRLMRVETNGSSSPIASIPLGPDSVGGSPMFMMYKDVVCSIAAFGSGFVGSTFTFSGLSSSTLGSIYSISADGTRVKLLAGCLHGIERMQFGPGGDFGSDLYVASMGSLVPESGAVYTMARDGVLTPFLTGINATDIAFDTEGVLGGGMFIGDLATDSLDASSRPGRIWRVISLNATAVSSPDAPRAELRLEQNVPNPAVGATTIRFSLPERARATVRIFDVSGRLVTTLLDREIGPGPQVVNWNGSNAHGGRVGSGVYYYEVWAKNLASGRKMILLR